jgi:hypothetical protein
MTKVRNRRRIWSPGGFFPSGKDGVSDKKYAIPVKSPQILHKDG